MEQRQQRLYQHIQQTKLLLHAEGRNMIVILVGESASGKSTLANAFIKINPSFTKVVTYTTRPMRQGEVDGIDYHFLSEDDFNKRKESGFFIEYASYRGWQYGTAVNFESGENKIIVLTPAGARALLKVGALHGHLRIVYLDVDRRSRLIKLLQRGDDIEEAYRRSLSDVGQFDAFNREADYVMYNKQYEKSVNQLCIELATYINQELERE